MYVMHTYVYTYVYIHTYIHSYIHSYIYTYIPTHKYIYHGYILALLARQHTTYIHTRICTCRTEDGRVRSVSGGRL